MSEPAASYTLSEDERFMREAIAQAREAETHGEVPVGAVLVLDGQIVARGRNAPISSRDPTAHAEIVALRGAGEALSDYRFPGSTLYVTLEPCVMCAGAMVHARVQRLVYGATDPKSGAAGTVVNVFDADTMNHRVTVCGGVLADECGSILRAFFKARR
ncbi:MAG: tRNA adenosine(34) deaminase TadA [Pseudomonadota bacterium]